MQRDQKFYKENTPEKSYHAESLEKD